MGFSCHVLLFSLLVAVAIIPCIHSLDYHVVNKAASSRGGSFFDDQIGEEFAKQKMAEAVKFSLKIFKQDSVYTKKNVRAITLIIDAEDTSYHHIHEEIHISTQFIDSELRSKKKAKIIFRGIIYQLVANVMQWDGADIPAGLLEGIGLYVRSKAGYLPATVLKLQRSDRWDQGGDVTVQFLIYCNSLKEGFVADLNDLMKSGFKESYFKSLLGRDVKQVWSAFKTRFMF